jgi:hypothetical protein
MKMSKYDTKFVLPTIEGTPIDSLNRRAAAVGSPGYAMQTAHANYNGHHVSLYWNDYKGYYVADYTWAGRNVIARGTFKQCLDACVTYYEKGHIGACVWITPRVDDPKLSDDTEALELIAANPQIITKEEDEANGSHLTWQHHCAIESVKDYCFPGQISLRFDWDLMQESDDRDNYINNLKAKYGNAYY